MPIAFVVGQRICLAAERGPKEIKKELFTLRGLCQRQRASKKFRNQLGHQLYDQACAVLETIGVSSSGPYNYETLQNLCIQHHYNCVIFSNLLAKPKLCLPYEQPKLSWPTIFLKEVSSLNPAHPDQKHLHVVANPDQVFKPTVCRFCLKMVISTKYHRYCMSRKNCFYCKRKIAQKYDYFNVLMAKSTCDSWLEGRPLAKSLGAGKGEKCKNCNQKIYT